MIHLRRLLAESLITRSGLLIGGITLLAVLSMLASLVIAEATRGNAAAINLAGSLRMQSYRIASRLLVKDQQSAALHDQRLRAEMADFEARLLDPALTRALHAGSPLPERYRGVEQTWHARLRPALHQLIQAGDSGATAHAAYLAEVDDFVVALNRLVKTLEEHTEDRIRLLRLVQGTALFITVILVFVVMYQLSAHVVQPLKELIAVAERIRQGDFAARVGRISGDELGMLGRAFNDAAQDLSASYRELEARVMAKTEALQESNRSLALLYNTARRLNSMDYGEDALRALLSDIEGLTGPGSTTLCLREPGGEANRLVQTSAESRIPTICQRPACDDCLGGAGAHCLIQAPHVLAFPIRAQNRDFGVLLVNNPPWQTETGWQSELLETVVEHIAVALRAHQQVERRRRLALLEERNVIARELHDSLAQALSYLKIQVAILQQRLARGQQDTVDLDTALGDLEEGLNNAYRHLRELLTTFRLSMDEDGLSAALRQTVAEFQQRSATPIHLRMMLDGAPLSPNQEIHILQIVREALSNAIRHAKASRIQIRADLQNQDLVRVAVRDDGIGLPAEPQRRHHYGLGIMQERARGLGGELTITSPPDGGTEIVLQFQTTTEETPAHA